MGDTAARVRGDRVCCLPPTRDVGGKSRSPPDIHGGAAAPKGKGQPWASARVIKIAGRHGLGFGRHPRRRAFRAGNAEIMEDGDWVATHPLRRLCAHAYAGSNKFSVERAPTIQFELNQNRCSSVYSVKPRLSPLRFPKRKPRFPQAGLSSL